MKDKAVREMDFIRIGTNKLKIMLTREDAAHYALCPDTADNTDTKTRRAFRAILTDIKARTDFDAAEDKVYIQIFPSREGGCELFVTKMGVSLSPKQATTGKAERTPKKRRELIFYFTSLEGLVAACRRLFLAKFKGESRVWLDDLGRYWLHLLEEGDPLTARHDHACLLEYGYMENRDNAALMLPEHGKMLACGNAVQVFSQL
ncbi:MAG: adaptor protein MecA [Ruminococcaceae bacterium]|nr:adaptor protein MecA [Oscillospiraceae bacterium]